MASTVQIDTEGAELVAERWGNGAPTLVLVHAGVCDRRSWLGVAPILARRATVVAYDRRGYGEVPPSPVPFSHLADLVSVIERLGEGPVVLVGSSMGGALALEVATARPDLVEGLILFAPGVTGAPLDAVMNPAEEELMARFDSAESAGDMDECNRIEVHYWLDGPSASEGRVAGPVRQLALTMNAGILAHGEPVHGGTTEGADDLWSQLRTITVPTTVICGELDEAYLVALASALADQVPGGQLVTLEGRAHLPYLEDPEESAGLILGALASGANG